MPGAPHDGGLVTRRNGNRISGPPSLQLDAGHFWKKLSSLLAVAIVIPELRNESTKATANKLDICVAEEWQQAKQGCIYRLRNLLESMTINYLS